MAGIWRVWRAVLTGRNESDQPTYSLDLVGAVVKLREQYPRWSKDTLLMLLAKEGYRTLASTVGRILAYARKRGILKEPVLNYVSANKRVRKRPHAERRVERAHRTHTEEFYEVTDTTFELDDLRPQLFK